jgi:hypothetical protein
VTVAHEFFHAVQFAYDVLEDIWFMESTATWMEDEVFDDDNQNLDYLSASSMRNGGVPVDDGDRSGFALYGNWVFIRFLSEYFGSANSPDPTIVRDAWEYADGATGGPDLYSIQAFAQAIEDRNSQFRWAFADFGATNLDPERSYEEGDSYPSAKINKTFRMTAANSDTGWWYFEPSHLTNTYVAYTPSNGVAGNAKLSVSMDGPKYATGPEGSVVVFYRNGNVKTFVFQLTASGDDTVRVPFGRGTVERAVLVLTNASTRYRCWRGTDFACSGVPKDDGLRYNFRATVV